MCRQTKVQRWEHRKHQPQEQGSVEDRRSNEAGRDSCRSDPEGGEMGVTGVYIEYVRPHMEDPLWVSNVRVGRAGDEVEHVGGGGS